MVVSKQINLKVSPRIYKKLIEEQEAGGFATMTELIEECIRYYLDRDSHTKLQKDAFIQFMQSEEGELWISALVDKELMKRAQKLQIFDQ